MLAQRGKLLMSDEAAQWADPILELDHALMVQIIRHRQVIVRAEHVLSLHCMVESEGLGLSHSRRYASTLLSHLVVIGIFLLVADRVQEDLWEEHLLDLG